MQNQLFPLQSRGFIASSLISWSRSEIKLYMSLMSLLPALGTWQLRKLVFKDEEMPQAPSKQTKSINLSWKWLALLQHRITSSSARFFLLARSLTPSLQLLWLYIQTNHSLVGTIEVPSVSLHSLDFHCQRWGKNTVQVPAMASILRYAR